MKLLASLADHRNSKSLAAKLRRGRFAYLRSLLESLPGRARILDVGGTADYWLSLEPESSSKWEITLLNLQLPQVRHPGFTYVQGDACDLSRFPDRGFEVVCSNSVIEHVGSFADQQRMAAEVQRVAQRYYVQTPNRNFPIEPHFLTPGFQFLPEWAQVWLLRHVPLGTYGRVSDRAAALSLVREIRLLTEAEFRLLFPAARIARERLCGMTKSFVATGGWEAATATAFASGPAESSLQ
jgi:hypothetical protein